MLTYQNPFSLGDIFMVANIIFFFFVAAKAFGKYRKKQREEKARHAFDRIPNNDYDALEREISKYGYNR